MSITLVGILNITPDSFSDGGEFAVPELALAHAAELFEAGASVVDIGAEATNPWATSITVDEEWRRLEPVVRTLLPSRPDFSFSLDTRHPAVVEHAARYGKFIVNDVTTFRDPEMVRVTAKHGLMAIASHLPLYFDGDIALAHALPTLDEPRIVTNELLQQKALMVAGGIRPERIILDPGIGFGKTMTLNWQLLEFAKFVPDDAVMIGFSRKRFLATDPGTGQAAAGRDKADTQLNLAAAQTAISASREATWLRVHEPGIYRDLLSKQ